MLVAFSAAVTALVGCQKKTEDNPPATTNAAADQAVPSAAAPVIASTNSSPMPTNPVSTNNP